MTESGLVNDPTGCAKRVFFWIYLCFTTTKSTRDMTSNPPACSVKKLPGENILES